MDRSAGAPVLNIFGGKITTYRGLIAKLRWIKSNRRFQGWDVLDRRRCAPRGNFPVDGVADLIDDLQTRYAFLTDKWVRRLVRAYGTDAAEVLASAKTTEDLGQDFGATFSKQKCSGSCSMNLHKLQKMCFGGAVNWGFG